MEILFRNCERAHWPPQGAHSLTLWWVVGLSATPSSFLPFFLRSTKNFFMRLVQTEQIGLTMLLIVIALHVIEALYVLYLLRPVLSTNLALLSWVVYSFIFGYPATSRAMELSKAHGRLKKS